MVADIQAGVKCSNQLLFARNLSEIGHCEKLHVSQQSFVLASNRRFVAVEKPLPNEKVVGEDRDQTLIWKQKWE